MKKLSILLVLGLVATFFACQKQKDNSTPDATNPALQLVSPSGLRLAESVDELLTRVQDKTAGALGKVTQITNVSYTETADGKSAAKVELLNDKGVKKEVVLTNYIPRGIDAQMPIERKVDFILLAWCNVEECSNCNMLVFTDEWLGGWSIDIYCTCCSLSFILWF
jgi:hypothetical protein